MKWCELSASASRSTSSRLRCDRIRAMGSFDLQLFGPILGLLLFLGAVVLAVPCGVLLYRSQRRTERPSFDPGLVLLGRVVFALLAGVVLIFKSNPFNARSFDRQAWATNNFQGTCGRGQMVGDLLRFHLRPGTTREVVVSL